MNKIKVCHISIAHPRYDQRIVEKEALSLKEAGYDVTVLVNDDRSNEVYKGIEIVSINSTLGSKIRRILAIKNAYKRAIEIDADIYHIHEPDLLLIANRLMKKNKKVIFDSHEYYKDELKFRVGKNKKIQEILKKLYSKYEDYFVKKVDGVIFPADKYKIQNELINPFKNIAKRVEYIANYPKIYKNTTKIEHEMFTVCYAGRLSNERGITNLIKACYRAKSKLILAGAFSTEAYEKEVYAMKEFECVEYRGRCSLDETYDIYRESDVGASVLLDYGQYHISQNLATKVYEYMQCGIPIISNYSEYNDQLNKKWHFAILVNPYDIDEIADAIVTLRENQKIREELIKNGSILANFHCWETEAEKLIKFYGEVFDE